MHQLDKDLGLLSDDEQGPRREKRGEDAVDSEEEDDDYSGSEQGSGSGSSSGEESDGESGSSDGEGDNKEPSSPKKKPTKPVSKSTNLQDARPSTKAKLNPSAPKKPSDSSSSSAPAEKETEKKKKDKNAPKSARSAYMFYVEAVRNRALLILCSSDQWCSRGTS